MREVMDYIRAKDLQVGDMVDLEGDEYADPNNDDMFTYEFETVERVEVETPECVCVYFGFDAVGFPTDHNLFVVSRMEPEDLL